MFDGVPISVATYLKSESESGEGTFEVGGVIDEKLGLIEVVFGAEFAERAGCKLGFQDLKRPYMVDLVRRGIDGDVQPVALVVDLNHCLVQGDPIRSHIAGRL